jgi:hypothetical protein
MSSYRMLMATGEIIADVRQFPRSCSFCSLAMELTLQGLLCLGHSKLHHFVYEMSVHVCSGVAKSANAIAVKVLDDSGY